MDQKIQHNVDAEIVGDKAHGVDCCIAGVVIRTIVVTTNVQTMVGSKFLLAR
jgi:hypothetical protein